ncbi:XRE family transcriptional regulator, partial [Streptomyces sp. SID625]|nr:XRE family transcriptional regulator [Streptomyces sp. SID625]
GIRPVVEAIATGPGVSNAPTAMAAGVQAFADALTALSRSVGREAHRNGTTPPDWITTAGPGSSAHRPEVIRPVRESGG